MPTCRRAIRRDERLRAELRRLRRMLSTLDRKVFRLQTLSDVSAEILRAPDDRSIFQIALSMMAGTFGIIEGAVVSLLSDGSIGEVIYARGLEEDSLQRLASLLDGKKGKTLVKLKSPCHLPRFNASRSSQMRLLQKELAEMPFKVWVPLLIDGDVIGGVFLGSKAAGRRFCDEELSLLSSIASQCALGIKSHRLFLQSLMQQQQMLWLRGVLEEHLDPRVAERLLADQHHFVHGERRKVSVLIGDLRGFTALSRQFQPEEVVLMLNDFFAAMTSVVFRHQGIVDKFIGDAVMAIFENGDGKKQAERGAVRAVLCALEMQSTFKKLEPRWGWQRTEDGLGGLGIGISSGEVVMGHVGSAKRVDFTVIGFPVNLAARLSQTARGGEILTDADTYFEVIRFAQAHKLHPLLLKGIPHPVELYQITGSKRRGKVRS